MSPSFPLCVDLDGTLIHSDMLLELSLRLFGQSPLSVLKIPFWLASGKAVLKRQLNDRLTFDPAALANAFDYIVLFYNRSRRHSMLDYASPQDFLANWSRSQHEHELAA